jgi:DNA-binding XRE family transcriptional regulator
MERAVAIEQLDDLFDFTINGDVDERLDLFDDGNEAADAERYYLRARWVYGVIAKLREARRQAGLTQEELALLLATKQPSIARLERGGNTTFLERIWDYLYTCGASPVELETVGYDALVAYVRDVPAFPVTLARIARHSQIATETAGIDFNSYNSVLIGLNQVLNRTEPEPFGQSLRQSLSIGVNSIAAPIPEKQQTPLLSAGRNPAA